MSPPLKIARLTPNGEIRTADLLTSIAKRLRIMARQSTSAGCALAQYAARLERLAATMEETP